MLSRRQLLSHAAAAAALPAIAATTTTAPGPSPNIVLIVSDDHGWTDYGFMGHPVIQTPRLDRLARQSAVFRRGYVAAPLCCPSLASILTGLHPHQHLITGNEPPRGTKGRERFYQLIDNAPTLPRLLGRRGYLSFQTGKWWHGHHRRGGFTHGMTESGRHGDAGLAIGRQTMQPIYDFIATARRERKPFFLWYAPMMPHSPFTPPPDLMARYQAKYPARNEAGYAGMVEWFDRTCGQLLDHLDEQGLAENTIVAYVADNGWAMGSSPMRGGKRSPYDGGIRTPILLRWPGRITPSMHDMPALSIDLAPTLLKAAGLATDSQGVDLLDLAAGKVKRDAIFGAAYEHDMADWNRPAQGLRHRWIIDGGRWKLIVPQGGPAELYDLAADPHETTDLSAGNPTVVTRLRARLDEWWKAEGV